MLELSTSLTVLTSPKYDYTDKYCLLRYAHIPSSDALAGHWLFPYIRINDTLVLPTLI